MFSDLSLPLSLLVLCQLFLSNRVHAAQQCRLQLNKNSLAGGGGDSGAPSEPTSTSTSAGDATAPPTSPPTSPTASASSVPTPFAYGKTPIRGVNLQPWITPSIFQNTGNENIVDEFTFGSMQDPSTALSVLQNHWATWITEEDFAAIAAAGLNHVRIPYGYWSVPLTSADTDGSTSTAPYTPGAWPYLLKALNWAKQYNIHVLLDLHGAPGSQNGFDNSGQRTGTPEWSINPANISRTVDTIRFVTENLGGMVDIIELLNEPAAFSTNTFPATLRQYWQDGYSAVRAVMIGDGFLGVDSWTNFLTAPSNLDSQGVMMDYLSRSFQDHISFACSSIQDLANFATGNIWTVVGEWSTAPTDCTQWLNGRGVGARWDGTWFIPNTPLGSCAGWTGSYSNFSAEYKTFLRQYWEVQVTMGESVQGWIYWTWKVGAPSYCLLPRLIFFRRRILMSGGTAPSIQLTDSIRTFAHEDLSCKLYERTLRENR
ncbi:glycoside hydrolase family 5 protein [Mycena alexandri]|uniref:Glycoside hydrolase family 5 protein n=1 Tax=Mycena alexandri TaxID=1745969 RepID=A0AAD6X150_9AGAR|nr:glycoside hydrolase family 5 protein [Mycena alexandri]